MLPRATDVPVWNERRTTVAGQGWKGGGLQRARRRAGSTQPLRDRWASVDLAVIAHLGFEKCEGVLLNQLH